MAIKRTNADGEHYRQGGIEPVDYIASHEMSFAEGNIVKYITRYKHKGDPVGDLEKVLFYVNELVQAQKRLLTASKKEGDSVPLVGHYTAPVGTYYSRRGR